MSNKQREQSIYCENIRWELKYCDENEENRTGKTERGKGGKRQKTEENTVARFISAFADSSPFPQKFRIRFAATAVSIIMLDDRPDLEVYSF